MNLHDLALRKELGKIKSALYGMGGYQSAQIGLFVDLGGEAWGVHDFWGYWAEGPSPGAKWSRADQLTAHGQTADRIARLLVSAKVKHVGQLVGVPVEVTFHGTTLDSWRVLSEVL